jgi:nucleotide-binding universal stress UspA family protein
MRLLIPTKRVPTEPMVSWLDAVARKTDLEVRLVTVRDAGGPPPDPGKLRGLVQAEAVTRTGETVAAVLAEAAAYEPAFIAIATRGLRGIVASVRGSLASALVAESTVPLALFGPQCRPSTTFERLILPLDGSAYAARSLPAIAAVARELQLGVTLVEVFHEERSGVAAPGDPGAARDILESSYLTNISHELHDVDIDWDVAHGDPAAVICDMVHDLPGRVIVMTSHGHAGIRRKLVGSVTEATVARSVAPVVVIPPGWSPAAATP